ncbi:hypothetical protein ACCE111639_08215 [Acinetobacter celticus]
MLLLHINSFPNQIGSVLIFIEEIFKFRPSVILAE